MASNTSKPFQSALIREHGFAIPATLVTTDRQAAVDFVAEHGQVIYKSVSSTRSIVRRFDPSDSGRLADVSWCPTQFQQYIAGEDVRVHIVGEDVFACAIDSDSDDYRYAAEDKVPKLRTVELAEDVEAKCRNLAGALDLPVAGIDLRHSDGVWYASGKPGSRLQLLSGATGQPIDRAIARLLVAPMAAFVTW
jgi:glutathione synthase/RimK-type ligase-like ATP-grasp enzyme